MYCSVSIIHSKTSIPKNSKSMVFRLHVVIVSLRKSVVNIRIVVGEEVNVSDSFSFEVILVINGRIVLPSGWLSFTDLRDKCSEGIVNEL